jgi:membrane protease YdiL (CAAX protease family)
MMIDPNATRGDRRPIAPIWHTIVLIAIILGIAAYGAYAQRSAGSQGQLVADRGSALPLYLGLIAAQWGLFRFCLVGLRKSGTRMRDVIGRRWATWRDVVRDVAIASAAWAVWTGAEALVAPMLGEDTAKSINSLLPRGPAEIVTWIALSVSAGICEEAIFRGYLQQQLEALSGSATIAIAAQALVFGVGHGYQGLRNTIVITVFAVLYGGLAHWRRSLRPGMIMHAWTDVFSGILARRG